MSSCLLPLHAQISIWRQCQASPYVCKLEEVFQVGWQGAVGEVWVTLVDSVLDKRKHNHRIRAWLPQTDCAPYI